VAPARPVTAVDGGAVRGLVPADLLRLVALLSVVVGLLAFGGVAGALFFLVLGGTMLPRALRAPAPLDVACSLVLLVAAWAAELDWYLAVGWLDVVVHAATTGLVAVLAHLVLVRLGAAPDVAGSTPARPRLARFVLTLCFGATLAVLWELGEWFGHTVLDDRIQVGYPDTVGDLAAGLLGAAVGGAVLARGRQPDGARR
jgi:hypothetical protein